MAEAVACYSEALQAITDGTYNEEKIAAWDDRLVKIFNRGYWNGYYMGERLGYIDLINVRAFETVCNVRLFDFPEV